MADIVLYHHFTSFYSQLARLALEEKGVAWKPHFVDIGPRIENYQPWYMRIHPSGVVPALDHDGQIIVETEVIMRYVDEHFAGPALVPEDETLRAQMDAWLARLFAFRSRELYYGLTSKKGPLKYIAPLVYQRRRRLLRKYKAQAPDLAACYDKRLADIDDWQATSSSPQEVEALRAQMQGFVTDLERDLSTSGGPFVLGEQYTLVDVFWTTLLARLSMFGLDQMWSQCPHITAYFKRVAARPSFTSADIWHKFHVTRLLPTALAFVLPRASALFLLLGLVGYGLWYLVGLL